MNEFNYALIVLNDVLNGMYTRQVGILTSFEAAVQAAYEEILKIDEPCDWECCDFIPDDKCRWQNGPGSESISVFICKSH